MQHTRIAMKFEIYLHKISLCPIIPPTRRVHRIHSDTSGAIKSNHNESDFNARNGHHWNHQIEGDWSTLRTLSPWLAYVAPRLSASNLVIDPCNIQRQRINALPCQQQVWDLLELYVCLAAEWVVKSISHYYLPTSLITFICPASFLGKCFRMGSNSTRISSWAFHALGNAFNATWFSISWLISPLLMMLVSGWIGTLHPIA